MSMNFTTLAETQQNLKNHSRSYSPDELKAKRKALFRDPGFKTINLPPSTKVKRVTSRNSNTELNKSAVSISTFRYGTTNEVISTGSGFITDDPNWGKLLLSAAHVAIPKFDDVNKVCYPYIVSQPPSGDVLSESTFGITTLNEWPFTYLADVFNNDHGVRKFEVPELLGVNWELDLAVFWFPTEFSQVSVPLSSEIPSEGDKVYAIGNMFGMVADQRHDGIVRKSRFQPEMLFRPHMLSTLGVDDSSSGCMVVNEVSEVVGMHVASSSEGTNLSQEFSSVDIIVAVKDIIRAVLYTDAILSLDGIDNLNIIMATKNETLGTVGKLLQSHMLDGSVPPPINAGHVSTASLPRSGLESSIKDKDLIISIDGNQIGPHSYQSTLQDTTVGLDKVDVSYLRWGIGGYGATPLTKTISTYQSVGNFWDWWFRWYLTPAGLSSDEDLTPPGLSLSSKDGPPNKDEVLDIISSKNGVPDGDMIKETVLREQFKTVFYLGPRIFGLGTSSLRSPLESDQESQRVEAILSGMAIMMDMYTNVAISRSDNMVVQASSIVGSNYNNHFHKRVVSIYVRYYKSIGMSHDDAMKNAETYVRNHFQKFYR